MRQAVNNPRLKPWACEENHSPELTHRGKKRLDWPSGKTHVRRQLGRRSW